MKKVLLLLFGLGLSYPAFSQGNNYVQNYQKFDNLALTPPMGWNSWNKFACNVDEKLIKEVADALVAHGMKDAGYTYINLDDCWHGERDAPGFIQPDVQRFPSVMKALADYSHEKGLKIGITDDLTKAALNAAQTTYRLRNPWARKDVGTTQKPFVATVPSPDVVLVVLSK